MACRGLEGEAFEVGETLFGIVESSGPYLLRVILLDAQDILLVVVVEVEVGRVELSVVEDDENYFIGVELPEVLSVVVIV